MRATQLAIGVVNFQAVFIEDSNRQRIFAAGLEPALIRVMDEGRVGNLFPPELVVVEMIAIQSLDIFAQRRRQGAFLGRSLAVGKTHRRVRIADMQRPHIGDQIAPRSDFNLDAQACQNS